MFNLNENNQFFISNAPTDMRVGVNAMCGKVRQAGGDPTDGKVYVFAGKTRKVMKLLHWERGGYVMYYKRIETGRLSPRLFPSDLHIGFREIRWDELVLFIRKLLWLLLVISALFYMFLCLFRDNDTKRESTHFVGKCGWSSLGGN